MRVCKKCGRNRADKFFVGTRGRICIKCRKASRKRGARGTHVAKHYEITMEEHDQIIEAQGGACVCGRKPRDVDHDHKVEKVAGTRASVRGVLCRSCNKSLAFVGDDPSRLRALAAYLESPPAHSVIDSERE